MGTSIRSLRIRHSDKTSQAASKRCDLSRHHPTKCTKRRASRQVFRSARHFLASFDENPLNLARLSWRRLKLGPISLVTQKVGMIERVQGRIHEHLRNRPVPHFLEATIRGQNVSADYPNRRGATSRFSRLRGDEGTDLPRLVFCSLLGIRKCLRN